MGHKYSSHSFNRREQFDEQQVAPSLISEIFLSVSVGAKNLSIWISFEILIF